jgi:hypothetical protein
VRYLHEHPAELLTALAGILEAVSEIRGSPGQGPRPQKADCLGTVGNLHSISRRDNPGELKIEDRQESKIANLQLAIFALPPLMVKISSL